MAPTKFVSIAEAKKENMRNQFVSLIGVAVGFMPPQTTFQRNPNRTPDSQVTMELCDQSASLYDTNLRVSIFRQDPSELPQDMEVGETIVILKNIKMGILPKKDNLPVGMTSKTSSSWVICKGQLPTRSRRKSINSQPKRPTIRVIDNGPQRLEDPESRKSLLTPEEYEACKDLVEFFNERGGLSGCYGVSNENYEAEHKAHERQKKAVLIKEIQLDSFYDLMGYVQKTWSNFGSNFEIQITDFTEHPNLYKWSFDPLGDGDDDDEDPVARHESYGYAYEAGGVTKKIKALGRDWYKKPFGRYALKVTLWDAMGMKAKDEISEGSYVLLQNVRIKMGINCWEGALSAARNGSFQKDGYKVIKPEDPVLKAMINRRKELEKAIIVRVNEKSEKLKKLQEEKAQAKLAAEMKRRQENNPQVHCGYVSMETTPISKIDNMLDGSDVQFYNRRYRTECRVVDFRPSDIRDFARPVGNDKGASSINPNSSVINSSGGAKPPPAWYWCFELDVVDKAEEKYLTIHVDDAAGRYLLTSEPCDLRADENSHRFNEVRQELFHLWGNLEEIKTRRREHLELIEKNANDLLEQYNEKNHSEQFLEKRYATIEKAREKVQKMPLIMDPAVKNKFFFAMIKEYGEDDEDGEPERKFVLENTSVSRPRVQKERQKAKERQEAEAARSNDGGVAGTSYEDAMVLD